MGLVHPNINLENPEKGVVCFPLKVRLFYLFIFFFCMVEHLTETLIVDGPREFVLLV